MTATAILRHEHEAILKMLDGTEEAARRMESGGSISQQTLTGLIEFFRLFADRCHHGKEEDLLFPALESRGMPRSGGPIGVMLVEHDQGRALVRKMAEATEALGAGDASASGRWASAARGFVDLLRSHIAKENDILFVMAERILTDGEQRKLAEDFERVEIERLGPGTHERLHASMDEILKDIFGGAKNAS